MRLICAVLTFIWMVVVIERYSLKTSTVEEFESIVPAEEREDDGQEPVVVKVPRTQQRGIKGLITTILDPDRSLMNVHEMRPGERARFVLGFLMCLLVIIV
ncbi:MAG: hypothetical protein IJ092_11785, partial [Atopobiaceae bacterium]|nr:hypothetical protein [Atopobiaceae bacterium]